MTQTQNKSAYRSGFVTIIGSPNVGKSTLMNRMVGQKISIVSDRAQTTRNRITGIVSRKDYQIIFLDTPGVTAPKNRLGEYMLKVTFDAVNEVEAILLMLDASVGIREKDELLLSRLGERCGKTAVVAAINKSDLVSLGDIDEIRERLETEPYIKDIVAISAETGRNVDKLETILCKYLTEGPQYYPDDMVTDQPMWAICGEMIRENALKLLRDEIPHGIGIGIDKIKLREDGIHDVFATIYCERETHKGIIIGHGGRMLKRIGSEAFRNKGEPSALGKGSSRLAQQCFRVERIRLYSRFLSDGRHLAEERCRFCNNRRLFIFALPEGTAVSEISFNISRCGKIGPKRFLCFFAAWSPVAFFAKCFGKELFLIVRGAAFCD